MRTSAIAPALIASIFIGVGAYWFNSEIGVFGHVAKDEVRSYVTSVPRDVRSLGSEFASARHQAVRSSQLVAGQVTLAARELHSAVTDQRRHRVLPDLHPSGSVAFALACGVAAFFIVYYRVVRKPTGAHTRLKVF